MNVALSAVVLLILFSPGAAFRISYLRNDSLQYTIDTSIVGELLYILITSSILHISCLYFLHERYDLNERTIYNILGVLLYLSSGKEDKLLFQTNEPEQIIAIIFYFITYILALLMLGTILGKITRWIVIRFNLDFYINFLKVSNQWEYLFSGRTITYETGQKVDFIQLDVVVSMEHGNVIYSGLLNEYYLDRGKKLDKLYLESVYRRALNNDKPEQKNYQYKTKKEFENEYRNQFDERYTKVNGYFLVVTSNEIKNLNISYISIEGNDDDENFFQRLTRFFNKFLPNIKNVFARKNNK